MHENIFNLSLRLICVYKIVSKENHKKERVSAEKKTNKKLKNEIKKTIKHLILLIALN